ncbi:hypothetical protein [Nakamurella leprariae]|uniref:Septum formation-related domain-containing protein n=1 Tax=Nakamurella leprariae TaxID=2803911 RepID=A0A939C116_9ACTN|nr:hypothetical protein [Nakamurella leprariae]MBM9466644.1 hypothetical protein [Nakamurella leprariae]
MERRRLGAAALITALVVVFALGVLRSRVIEGEAVAVPIPPSPQAGDCVVQDPRQIAGQLHQWAWGGSYVSLRTAPCTGPRYGEVVEVRSGDDAVDVADASGWQEECRGQVYRLIGLDLRTEERAPFLPVVQVGLALTGPDPRAAAAGQRWSACVATLTRPASTGSTLGFAPASGTVDHPLAGAWSRGEQRPFAVCTDDPAGPDAVPCDQPHRFEMLGRGRGEPGATQASLERACADLAVRAVGAESPLRDGALISRALAVRPGPVGGPPVTGPAAISADGAFTAMCLVASADPTRQLVASIRGTGTGPVPLR